MNNKPSEALAIPVVEDIVEDPVVTCEALSRRRKIWGGGAEGPTRLPWTVLRTRYDVSGWGTLVLSGEAWDSLLGSGVGEEEQRETRTTRIIKYIESLLWRKTKVLNKEWFMYCKRTDCVGVNPTESGTI